MIELTALAVIGITFAIVLVCIAVVAVVKAAVWLIWFPLSLIGRLLLTVLRLPFLLIKGAVAGALLLLRGRVLVVLALLGMVTLAAVAAGPLAPVLLLVFGVWLFARLGRRPLIAR